VLAAWFFGFGLAGFGGLGCAEFGFGSEDSVFGVEDGFFDGGECFFGFQQGWKRCGFGQVEGGDLETVEEQAGAARVYSVERDAAEDDADGGLDGGTVFGVGQDEGGLGGFGVGLEASARSEFRNGNGWASGVVVVAKYFFAEADAAATVSVGEDMAALETFRLLCGFSGHSVGSPPP
jgi:hypothetical protein